MDKQQKPPESMHDIFSKPLPVIIDEIELATADARKAASEARTAGEQAAEEVMKRLRKTFLKMARDIQDELAETKK
jgi:predicted DsbA family dithiol-disulfide isomerase